MDKGIKSMYAAARCNRVICVHYVAGTPIINAARQVVAELVGQFGDWPIVFQDKSGSWDQLRHDKGVFTGVLIHGARSLDTAMALVSRV